MYRAGNLRAGGETRKTRVMSGTSSIAPRAARALLALTTLLASTACTVRLANDPPPSDLLTVAEQTGFKGTAHYADVVALCDRLAAISPLVRRASLGTSFEGRDLPLLIVADPPVATAAEARASGKLILFAFADIHAGEVCGKEALPMFAREIVMDPSRSDHRDLLAHAVLVFAPIYNADGNERFAANAKNRPGQDGPELGMGQRANAQRLDLNRDYMKLEAPESVAMVRFLDEWDPDVVIDTHTTDGSFHRYLVTYDAPLNPAGARGPREWVRDVLLPEVTRRLFERTGWHTYFYGNFDADHTTWTTYSHEPRFGGNYHGLRGNLSILSEAYAYAPFEDRVRGTLEFVRECFAECVENAATVRRLKREGEEETTRLGKTGGDPVGIRFEIAAAHEKVTLLGFDHDDAPPGPPPPALTPKDYLVTHCDRYEPTLTVLRPRAYLIPHDLGVVVDKLRAHGIRVETLAAPEEVEVEVERMVRVDHRPEAFQGHHETEVDTLARREVRTVPAGTVRVPLDQPLGTLAVYLLEARSDDGLVTWNFLDASLAVGADYPIVRVPPDVTGAASR